MAIEQIEAYLSELPCSITSQQHDQLMQLEGLYREWNSMINVISRKDIDELYLHHVMHSLSILHMIRFKPGTKIIDVGCGGGFPGIPLAILLPDVQFLLVDSIGKKLKVVDAISEALGLSNVRTLHARVESVKAGADFVVSRAAMKLPDLVKLSKHLIKSQGINALPNGFITLKGGDLTDELKPFAKHSFIEESIIDYVDHPFFADKKIVYLPI